MTGGVQLLRLKISTPRVSGHPSVQIAPPGANSQPNFLLEQATGGTPGAHNLCPFLFFGVRNPNPASELPFKPPRDRLEAIFSKIMKIMKIMIFFFRSELIPGVPGVGLRGQGLKIKPPQGSRS